MVQHSLKALSVAARSVPSNQQLLTFLGLQHSSKRVWDIHEGNARHSEAASKMKIAFPEVRAAVGDGHNGNSGNSKQDC